MDEQGLWRLFWTTGLPEAYLMARCGPHGETAGGTQQRGDG